MTSVQMSVLAGRIEQALAGNPPSEAERYTIECEYERTLAQEYGCEPVFPPAPVDIGALWHAYQFEDVKGHTIVRTHVQSGANRYELFNLPVTAVLRWMGANGYKAGQAKRVLEALGVQGVSPSTVNCQLVGGRNGTRGTVPMLKPEFVAQIERARS